MRSWTIVLVVATACGGGEKQATPMQPKPPLVGPAQPAFVGLPKDPEPDRFKEPEPPPPPPAPPAPPHVAVLIPGTYSAMLFKDEWTRLDAAARAAVAAQTAVPVTLVPEADIAALKKLVAAGRVREGGPKCAKPPTLERATRLHYPDAWAVQSETACMGDECTLWLYVKRPAEILDWRESGRWPSLAEGSVNVKAVTDVAAFESAMRTITLAHAEPAGVEGGMIGGIGHGFGMGGGGPAHRNLILDVEAAGPWTAVPTTKDLEGEQRKFDACPATKGLFDDIVFDVDAKGKVDRCETEASKCLCDVIRGHAFTAGAPLRRAVVHFGNSGGGVMFGHGLGGNIGLRKKEVMVFIRGYGSHFGDDSDVMHANEKQLKTCFGPVAQPEKFNAEVELAVDERGLVTEAHVTKGKDHVSDKEAACVTKWARSLSFSCETLGGDPAELTTMLMISR